MKITDQIIIPKSPHVPIEQYSPRESMKSFAPVQHSEGVGTASRTSRVSDVVSLTSQAKLNSKQASLPVRMVAGDSSATGVNSQSQSPVKANSADQSASDYTAKGGEAIVQLIEMLTGIKVKLLTQADLLQADKQRNADAARATEAEQAQTNSAETAVVAPAADTAATQTNGLLKFPDGKEVSFSLDMVLPKSAVSSAGLDLKGESLSRNGIEISLQKKTADSTAQEHAAPKPVKSATDKEVRHQEKSSGSGEVSTRYIVKIPKAESSTVSEPIGGTSERSRVIGRLTLDATANHAV
jgi:hypothetical protein